jgi:photosystem II stability/assembly factor-like uncharacterized protein
MREIYTIIIIAIALLQTNINIYAQTYKDSIYWVNVNPYPITYNAVKFIDNNIAVAVGGNGGIIKSSDGGNNWYPITSPTTSYLYSLSFLNSSIGFALGDLTVIKTLDGGNSWKEIQMNVQDVFKGICFSPNGNGFIVGNKGIYRSTDKGVTWNTVSNVGSSSISFPSNKIGYASSSSSILKTIDNGNTWNAINSLNSTYPIETVNFANENIGYAGYYVSASGFASGGIYKTKDGGVTWTEIRTSMRTKSIFLRDSNNVSLAGQTGISGYSEGGILYTKDGGSNWSSKFNSVTLNSIDVNGKNGVAVGYAGTILISNDSGFTWTEKRIPAHRSSYSAVNVKDISFLNDSIGLLVSGEICPVSMCGPSGEILKTTNGGRTWIQVFSAYMFNKVFFIDGNNAYAGGQGLYKSSDGGNTWSLIHIPINPLPIRSIFFLDKDTGFVGTNGSILKTTDAGNSWKTIATQGNPTDIYFFNSSQGIMSFSFL